MTDNTAPERVTLIVTRDGRVNSVLGHGTIGSPRMDADAVEYVRADILRNLATRKPVGDGDEVVVRLTREEAQVLVGRAELAFGGVATLDTRIRTPLGDKLRAALREQKQEEGNG